MWNLLQVTLSDDDDEGDVTVRRHKKLRRSVVISDDDDSETEGKGLTKVLKIPKIPNKTG